MITITPEKYIPFKRRIRNAFIGAFILAIGLGSFIAIGNLSSNTTQAAVNQTESPNFKLQMYCFLGGMVLLFCGVVVLSQAWILDSIMIDEKTKKLKILYRKFDRVVDKGEYDIDNIKIKIITKHPPNSQPTQTLIIKYGKKRIVNQNNTTFAGTPGWTKELYAKVKEEVEKIA
ncbi:MAG TPA: hypothetical protein VNZ45_02965 [Bacteroidia bacterium]|jgi:hypothetical protein|nr:hypothetical protein [Bacteroidia bacterium]